MKSLCIFQLQDTETTSGESEVKFQVSRDTLGAMLRSMAYIREQLSYAVSVLFLLSLCTGCMGYKIYYNLYRLLFLLYYFAVCVCDNASSTTQSKFALGARISPRIM